MPYRPASSLANARWVRLVKSLDIAGAYAAWTLIFRLFLLTFITYFLMSSGARSPRFEDISEAFGANELTLMGVSVSCFIGLLLAFNPLTTTSPKDVWDPSKLEKQFMPGFFHGTMLAAGVTLAFLLSGTHKYLGFFIQFDDAPMSALIILVRIAAMLAFAYFEEFIFRDKFTRHVRGLLPQSFSGFYAELAIAGLVALVYCAIKQLQFDLGVMHLLTLFLISMTLSVRSIIDGGFVRGAGFWAALLILFQPLLSLPALGGDFSGLVLIKFQPGPEGTDNLIRLLTGGAGGPLSGFALQLILLLDLIRGIVKIAPTKQEKPRNA